MPEIDVEGFRRVWRVLGGYGGSGIDVEGLRLVWRVFTGVWRAWD